VSTPERTDIANAECLVLIGSHLGENMHNTQVQEFAQAIEKGASIIVVDPRFSVAASKAQHYLPIKPGTDIALLLAWMNVLVTEELYDKEYVDAYGFGFDAFAADIAPYTPEWAYPKTSLNPALIRETAREMARHKPASLVHPGRHVTWYGDDAQRSRAIALLNALLGSWGRKGGFYYPSGMDVPGYPYPDYPVPSRPKADNPDHKYPFADGTLSNGIRDATISGKPYPIKGWMVYATNLIEALPNQEETIRAIQELDLMVVVDVIPSEIAGWADVVLPEAVYLERYDDLHVSWFRQPFVGLRQGGGSRASWRTSLVCKRTTPGRTSRTTSGRGSRARASASTSSSARVSSSGPSNRSTSTKVCLRNLIRHRVRSSSTRRSLPRPVSIRCPSSRLPRSRLQGRSVCSTGGLRCIPLAERRPIRSYRT